MKQRSLVRPGRRSIAVSVVTALIAGFLGIVGFVSAQPAQAALGGNPAWTFNMQGGQSNGAPAFTLGVAPLLRTENALVALQEVGPNPPPNASNTAQQIIAGNQLAPLPPTITDQLPANPLAQQVRHTQWHAITSNYDFYFLQTDANGGTYTGGRVNIGIVLPRAADEVVIIPGHVGGRAALGVLLSGTWYFSIHAFSGGGNDGPGLLANIRAFLRSRTINGGPDHQDGLVLGDYNRNTSAWTPQQLGAGEDGNAAPNSQVVTTGGPTQRSGNNLDYGIMVNIDRIFPP